MLALPEGQTQPFIDSLRAWAEADDGRPVYLLETMRYLPENISYPGSPRFHGTPQEANAYYERHVAASLLKRAAYPVLAGTAQGQNLIKTSPAQVAWSTVQVVRFPSRRAFLELLADPAYAANAPYKFMALETDIVPVSGEVVIPDARCLVGGALIAAFLAIGWRRAARA